MKPIQPHERKVANIHDEAAFQVYDPTGERETGTSFIQLNPDAPRDVGFYIYRMAPGARSTPHMHGGAEEFLMVVGGGPAGMKAATITRRARVAATIVPYSLSRPVSGRWMQEMG